MSIVVVKKRKFWPYAILSLFLFYLFHWLWKLYEVSPVPNPLEDIFGISRIEWTLVHLGEKSWIDLAMTGNSLLAGMVGVVCALLFYLRRQTVGTFRYGEEHGSARYATQEELDRLKDKDEYKNMILSQKARMGLYNRRLSFDRQVNKNVLGIGGTGDSKTRSLIKPNALQQNSSYLFTDTKGLLVHELGHSLEQAGYHIKIFDVITFLNSNKFNCFHYMRNELDIDRIAEAIVTATKRSDNRGEDFWIQAQMLLMRALIGYLYFDSQVSGYEANLPQLSDIARYLDRQDPEVESVVERMFEDLEKELPDNYANRQWQLFKLFKSETRTSVYAMVASIVSVFDHDVVRRLVETDNMEIDTWNLQKTAVFVMMPEVNPAYQFLTSLFFSIVFDVTFKTADDILLGRRTDIDYPLHLQIEGDEWAQVGKVPHLAAVIAVIRSREISLKMMIQSKSQLEKLYGKEDTKTIINNCGSIIYLGGSDDDTLKWLSERSGPGTIDDRNASENRGRNGSSSIQNSKIKRELLTPHEISTIGITETLVFVNRHNVFRDQKFDLDSHPRASFLGNHPKDDTWYRYVRYMSDIEEFRGQVRPSRLIELAEEEVEKVA
ncbi:VirD4-like conjugal transfer protein, CD1115 family [Streptococcus cuniculi]|uniref:Type IV secretory system conjugative DNA transfer family protein n=1 Tax=Streptococcus cuniculi TaxID=1432788 RepID=A0A4Y9J848_9STRE|nr:type IV secretory system conjugative DNA transfer family protein [Streptococcus cuniculi]MBF0778916.1 type IV secretory system conjugative DNA transfer family protein [Streptococcus cuniculi]TFU97190.1 type IV secretory system conjugative DNA transfer family protein [Streptococcus cuniculi]